MPSTTRRLVNAADEVTRIVGTAPPVAPDILHAGTRLTGRWRNGPYEIDTRPMREHVIAMTFDGRGVAGAKLGGTEVVQAMRPGGVTLAPRGHYGRWRIAGEATVSNIYLGAERLQASADVLAEGRAFELLDRVNHVDPRLFSIMRMICMEVENPGPHARIFLEEAVDLFCVELLRSHSTLGRLALRPLQGLAPWQVRRVVAHMQECLAHEVSLQELADLVGISRYHFCNAFRKATGHAPHEYLTRLRMHAACDLLSRTRLPIVDIAVSVGYGTPSAFSTAFRRVMGVSPRDFRQRL